MWQNYGNKSVLTLPKNLEIIFGNEYQHRLLHAIDQFEHQQHPCLIIVNNEKINKNYVSNGKKYDSLVRLTKYKKTMKAQLVECDKRCFGAKATHTQQRPYEKLKMSMSNFSLSIAPSNVVWGDLYAEVYPIFGTDFLFLVKMIFLLKKEKKIYAIR